MLENSEVNVISKMSSENSPWEKEKIAGLESYNFHKDAWNKVSAVLWREVLRETDDQLIVIIKDILANAPGPELALRVLHQITKLSTDHRVHKLLQIIIPEWRSWLSTLTKLKSKMSVPDSGVLEETLYEQRDITYLLNNISKDLIYMSFAYNLKHSRQSDEVDQQLVFSNATARVKIFSELPEELRNPKNWEFRWNLKDRVWVLYSKSGKKYLLRERKAPHHMDHLNGEPVNTYSQPSIDEAEKAEAFPTFQTRDYVLNKEIPIVGVDIQTQKGISSLQFAVYEYLEGVKDSLTLDEYSLLIFNQEAIQNSEQERRQYEEVCESLAIEPVSPADYLQLKAYYGSILLPKYLYKHAFADANYFNTDGDGFAISINGHGQLVLTAFDFEKVEAGRDDGLDLDRQNDTHFLTSLKKRLELLRKDPSKAFSDIVIDTSDISRQNPDEIFSQIKETQQKIDSLAESLEQQHPEIFKRLIESMGDGSGNDKKKQSFVTLIEDTENVNQEAQKLLFELQNALLNQDEPAESSVTLSAEELQWDTVALALRSFIKSSYRGSAYPQLAVSLSSAITPFYNQYLDRFRKKRQEGIVDSFVQKEKPLAIMLALATICANYDYHLVEFKDLVP